MNYQEAMTRLERAERRQAMWSWAWLLVRVTVLLGGTALLGYWWLR